MECRGFAVDAEWVTAMVAGWLGGGYGGEVVGIRYRRGPTGVRNMRVVLKKASCGTRRISEAFGVKNRLLRYG